MKFINKCFIVFFILTTLGFHLFSQQYTPGQIYNGRNNYIEYHAGNLPLIFAAPHGGGLTPTKIPDRNYGTIVRDSYTKETTLAIKEAVFKLTGGYPHLIICNLHRTKIDANREIVEATQGNQFAETAWNEFHEFIKTAKKQVTDNFGKGMFVDIHGHGHEIQRLELGYMTTTSDLFKSDSQLNSDVFANSSSIRSLVAASGVSYSLLLRGDKSLGSLFEQKGIPATPSFNQPNPGVANQYFSGGFNTYTHGSALSGSIDGVQIEAHYKGLRDTPANRSFYATIITEVFDEFFRLHYGWKGIITNIDKKELVQNETVYLNQNYPNPFNFLTNIEFTLPENGFVNLTVYDILGRPVKTLINEYKDKGIHKLNFSAQSLPSSFYLYILKFNNTVFSRKMTLLK